MRQVDAGVASVSVRTEDVVSTVVDGQVVLLDLRRATYLRINRSGRVLWERLELGASRDELSTALAQRYGIDASRASTDVEQFLAMLEARDLLA